MFIQSEFSSQSLTAKFYVPPEFHNGGGGGGGASKKPFSDILHFKETPDKHRVKGGTLL